MPPNNAWSVVFYIDRRGKSPVEDYILSLDPKTGGRLTALIANLRASGGKLEFPKARHLEGKLWELRQETHTGIYRIVYFTYTGKRIIILHAFQKKTERTDESDLDTARRRYGDFADE